MSGIIPHSCYLLTLTRFCMERRNPDAFMLLKFYMPLWVYPWIGV